jgi:hypothetical protein
MGRSVVVVLDDDQQAELVPVMREAREAYKAGALGVVLAQVHGEHMKVRFIPHEEAKAIQAIIAAFRAKER